MITTDQESIANNKRLRNRKNKNKNKNNYNNNNNNITGEDGYNNGYYSTDVLENRSTIYKNIPESDITSTEALSTQQPLKIKPVRDYNSFPLLLPSDEPQVGPSLIPFPPSYLILSSDLRFSLRGSSSCLSILILLFHSSSYLGWRSSIIPYLRITGLETRSGIKGRNRRIV